MENQPTCKACNKPMNFIKAGVSRTSGRPYDAFWACPDKCKQLKATPGDQNGAVVDKSVGNGNMLVLEEIQALRADFNKRMNDMATFLVEKLGGDKKEELPPLKDIKF